MALKGKVAERRSARKKSEIINDPLFNNVEETPSNNRINDSVEENITDKKIEEVPQFSSNKNQLNNFEVENLNKLKKEDLEEIAKKLGYKLINKRTYIKHSFSITEDHLDLFRSYCHGLDFKMQEALHEALEDWFNKYSNDYKDIIETKRRSKLRVNI